MSADDLVRPSRDGDQFHYAWAARQALQLLSTQSGLTAVTIEGASVVDKEGPDGLLGDELIDVGLYFGSEKPADAQAIRYIQLKHSTRRTTQSWIPGELEKTLAGFGGRYKARLKTLKAAFAAGRIRFQFISNRRFSKPILTSLKQLAEGVTPTHADTAASLVRFSGLKGAQVQAFFSLLDVDGSAPGVWSQRNLLSEELRGYLPEADIDGPVQLKELVTRKATSEFETNPTILRQDVLRALKASEEDLFPAPSCIPAPDGTIARRQEADILRTIIGAAQPVIIHADGGVGKSVLAARLAQGMPTGSSAILYDCYGVGLYLNALDFRHRHQDGLVQIANELASRGWCHPLVPTSRADPTKYMRAFAYRLEQAARHLKASHPTGVLCVIIDAADNAEEAARTQGDPGSFVRDVIRMPVPDGVRLVFTSRTHRVVHFNPPAEAIRIELEPFDETETGQHLRARFADATDAEVREFDYLSSHNPRVQALALQGEDGLRQVLKALGPEPTTVAMAIGGLLQGAIAKLKSDAGTVEAEQIDRICVGLATLRPLVPIAVISKMSDVPEGAVRSFVTDLGRPLRLAGDSVHFRDESKPGLGRPLNRPASA